MCFAGEPGTLWKFSKHMVFSTAYCPCPWHSVLQSTSYMGVERILVKSSHLTLILHYISQGLWLPQREVPYCSYIPDNIQEPDLRLLCQLVMLRKNTGFFFTHHEEYKWFISTGYNKHSLRQVCRLFRGLIQPWLVMHKMAPCHRNHLFLCLGLLPCQLPCPLHAYIHPSNAFCGLVGWTQQHALGHVNHSGEPCPCHDDRWIGQLDDSCYYCDWRTANQNEWVQAVGDWACVPRYHHQGSLF